MIQTTLQTVLDPPVCIAGMLNDVFVTGLFGLAGLPVHPQGFMFTLAKIIILQEYRFAFVYKRRKCILN